VRLKSLLVIRFFIGPAGVSIWQFFSVSQEQDSSRPWDPFFLIVFFLPPVVGSSTIFFLSADFRARNFTHNRCRPLAQKELYFFLRRVVFFCSYRFLWRLGEESDFACAVCRFSLSPSFSQVRAVPRALKLLSLQRRVNQSVSRCCCCCVAVCQTDLQDQGALGRPRYEAFLTDVIFWFSLEFSFGPPPPLALCSPVCRKTPGAAINCFPPMWLRVLCACV